MKDKLFPVLKIAVVVMMLSWAVKTAQARRGCEDPTGYASCMSECGTQASDCGSLCSDEYNCNIACVDGPTDPCLNCEANLQTCEGQCNTTASNCENQCYSSWCL
jgi:hypothetical protein